MRLKQILLTISLAFTVFCIKAQPIANFSSDLQNGCAPLTASFVNNSTGAVSYIWDFGNGSGSTAINPVAVYNVPGIYTVTLIATASNGQSDTLINTAYIQVANTPVSSFIQSSTSGCPYMTSFTFTNTATNSNSWLWDFGDGSTSVQQNPTHVFPIAGTFYVKLIAYNSGGCSHLYTSSTPIVINPQPNVLFDASQNLLCTPGQQVTFTPTVTTNTSYSWNFGNGNTSSTVIPTSTYSQPGIFPVQLICSNQFGCLDTLIQQAMITVKNNFIPAMTLSDSTGCLPLNVTFNTPVSSGISSYLWDFGNGSTSTLSTVNHAYNSSGIYNISLTITTVDGCIYSNNSGNQVEIPAPAQPMFSATNTNGCAPLAVSFTNQSQNAVSYNWDFGTSNYSTDVNPTYVYGGAGGFTVILHAFNSIGCESIYTMPNAVTTTRPYAAFSAANVGGCGPLTVTFSNQTTGAVQYLWYFGDGSTSTQQAPVYTYNVPGIYTVSLVAISAAGCRDSIAQVGLINVFNPAASYSPPPVISSCVPYNIAFNDNSIGATGWLWDFGDGSTSNLPNPEHIYTTPGDYTVSLVIYMAGGCNQYYPNYHSYHLEQMEAGYMLAIDCANGGIQFTDTTAGATTWLWDFGDGSYSSDQSPFHVYDNDIFTISLTVGNSIGCTQSVMGFNQADMTSCTGGSGSPGTGSSGTVVMNNINIEGCAIYQGAFYNPFVSTATLLWDFGDGNTAITQDAFHDYASAGVYTVKLVLQDVNGDIDTIQYNNALKIGQAIADFDITNFPNCNNPEVVIQDASLNAAEWLWSFGDGTIDSVQNPMHLYTNVNSYSIVLSVQDTLGCVSQTTATVFNQPYNTLWADKYKTCKNGVVNFFFSSSSFNSYLWDFGDGTTSTLQNPSHTYITGGNFSVSITVTDNNNCPFTYFLPQPVVVYDPVANFSFAQTGACNSNSEAFTNLSTGAGSPLQNFSAWSYGDGANQWAANPIHNYAFAGTYPVTLTIYAPISGCNNAITQMVPVGVPYVNFGFTQDKTCLPVTATFTDSSGNAVSWFWEFGDGTTSTLQNPIHIYSTVPTNFVRLTITDNRGCQSTILKPGIQLINAGIMFGDISGCAPFPVTFNDTTQNAVTWNWNFGDGGISSLQNPSHIYTTGGQYTAEVIITRADGCSDTIEITPILIEKPESIFFSTSVATCTPALMQFTNNSINASTYYWNFGDNTQSNLLNPDHIYNLPGYYDVTLVAYSPMGCADTSVLNDYVHIPGPVAGFNATVNASCGFAEVIFTNSSTESDFGTWNFGDGNSDSILNPTHIYNLPGTYNVNLFVSDSAGCTSFISIPVSVNELVVPDASFTLSAMSGCSPMAVTITNTSVNAVNFNWNMGNGSVFTNNNPTFNFTYNSPGTYFIKLLAESPDGCWDTLIVGPLEIHEPPHVSFSTSEESGCPGLTSLFTPMVSGADIISYNWTFGNGQTSILQQPNMVFGPGSFTISLTVIDINGCSATSVVNNLINVADSVPPAAPQLKRVSVIDDQSITIEWFASSSSDVEIYKLYRKNISTGNFDFVTNVSNNQLSYIDNYLSTLQNSYCYKVVAVDSCGFSLPVDASETHCSIEVTANRITNNEVLVDWNYYAGTAVSGYEIHRSYNGSPFQLYSVVGAIVNNWTDTTNYCNGIYRYKIRATGLHGMNIISWSDTTAVDPGGYDFSNLNAEMKRSTVVDNKNVLTEWILPQELEVVTSSVKLYRSIDKISYSFVSEIPLPYTSYLDTDVDVNGQNYFYKIEPVNTCLLEIPVNISSSVLLQGERIEDFKTRFNWTEYEQWSEGVEEYYLQKKDPNGNWITIKVVPGNVSTTEIDE